MTNPLVSSRNCLPLNGVPGQVVVKTISGASWAPSPLSVAQLAILGYATVNSPIDLNLSGDTSLTGLTLRATGMGSIDVSGDTALATLQLDNNPLASIDVSTNAALTNLTLFGCAITVQAKIDAILVSLDGFGLSGGTCSLSGGTNAAPGAPGLAAKANLIGKGWSVDTN